MIFAMFWENPAVVGLILALPATALGYLAYRRSLPVDKAVQQVGEMAGHIGLITALQADNQVLRDGVTALRKGVEVCQARIDVLEVGGTDLLAKNRELEQREVELTRAVKAAEREIAVLHAENDALKFENTELKARISELEKANG